MLGGNPKGLAQSILERRLLPLLTSGAASCIRSPCLSPLSSHSHGVESRQLPQARIVLLPCCAVLLKQARCEEFPCAPEQAACCSLDFVQAVSRQTLHARHEILRRRRPECCSQSAYPLV